MRSVVRAWDWVLDSALPATLIAAVAAVWATATVLLFLTAWWAGTICFLAGVPFAVALWNDRADRRLV